MLDRFVKILFFSLFFAVFGLLAGCGGESHLAPVVDAWHNPRPESSTYVVRSGDTIYSIAWIFGLDYRALAAANHLTPPYTLTNGQRLVMTYEPAKPGAAPMASPEVVMPVQPSVVSLGQKPTQAPNPASQPSAMPPQPEAPSYQPYYHFSGQWQWPAKGRIIQGFSNNPAGQQGISIAGNAGSPIRAAADGVVVYSGDGVRGYGNLIIIKQNDSYLSAYAFNQQNLVSVGEPVRAGSVIARMGQNDAGRTLLYFEIRRNGIPVNPLRYLR